MYETACEMVIYVEPMDVTIIYKKKEYYELIVSLYMLFFHLHVHAMEHDHSTQVGLEHINHDNIIDTVRKGDYEISVQRPTK